MRETDRQTDRQTNRHTDTQANMILRDTQTQTKREKERPQMLHILPCFNKAMHENIFIVPMSANISLL